MLRNKIFNKLKTGVYSYYMLKNGIWSSWNLKDSVSFLWQSNGVISFYNLFKRHRLVKPIFCTRTWAKSMTSNGVLISLFFVCKPLFYILVLSIISYSLFVILFCKPNLEPHKHLFYICFSVLHIFNVPVT